MENKKLVNYRLSEETRGDIDYLVNELQTRLGIRITATNVIEYAIKNLADEFRSEDMGSED